MIGLYATITVAVKNTLLFKYSLVFYSVLSDIQVNCNNHYTISANLSCWGRLNRRDRLQFFRLTNNNHLFYPPKIVRFVMENAQTHLGLYIMSLLKFLQDYLWQCSNTRYYFGLTLTLTEPKINFNLDTLPNPSFLLPRIEITSNVFIFE